MAAEVESKFFENKLPLLARPLFMYAWLAAALHAFLLPLYNRGRQEEGVPLLEAMVLPLGVVRRVTRPRHLISIEVKQTYEQDRVERGRIPDTARASQLEHHV